MASLVFVSLPHSHSVAGGTERLPSSLRSSGGRGSMTSQTGLSSDSCGGFWGGKREFPSLAWSPCTALVLKKPSGLFQHPVLAEYIYSTACRGYQRWSTDRIHSRLPGGGHRMSPGPPCLQDPSEPSGAVGGRLCGVGGTTGPRVPGEAVMRRSDSFHELAGK